MRNDVRVLMLDPSKAFGRVSYCKLFAVLLKRDKSPIVLRILVFMYTHQSLRVKWGNTLSEQFSVINGIRELSSILFAVYTNGLLERLENAGVGSHMGSRFVGALAYADDITLLALCESALSILITLCENYAAEYDIIFIRNKSKLLFIKSRSSVMMQTENMVNGQIVSVSEKKQVHLDHTVSTMDRDCHGHVADIMRRTRAKYHYVIRRTKNNNQLLKNRAMARAIAQRKSRELWTEVNKIKSSKTHATN